MHLCSKWLKQISGEKQPKLVGHLIWKRLYWLIHKATINSLADRKLVNLWHVTESCFLRSSSLVQLFLFPQAIKLITESLYISIRRRLYTETSTADKRFHLLQILCSTLNLDHK